MLTPTIPAAVGALVREHRRTEGLTQTQLAERIGASRFWVAAFEKRAAAERQANYHTQLANPFAHATVPDAINCVIAEHDPDHDTQTIVTRLMEPIGNHVTRCVERL